MQAVILAAGMGTRLGSLTRNTPKSLLDLGNGFTVLESQLAALNQAGIRDIVVVEGYLSEQIEAKVKTLNGLNLTLVYNPFYKTTNNLVSLWMALPHLSGDFISINGDDVFHPDVISALMDSPGEVVMTTDRKDRYDEDDMKVLLVGERVLKVGKEIPVDEANGESVGIIKYVGRGSTRMRETLSRMVRQEANHHVFYLKAIQEIIDSGFPVVSCEIPREMWTEIDFHQDLANLRSIILEKTKPIVRWMDA